MRKNSLFISYNDSNADITRAAFFSEACKFSSIKFNALVNDSIPKIKFLSLIGLNYQTVSKMQIFVNFWYGLILVNKIKKLQINSKAKESLFSAFVITQPKRNSSFTEINIIRKSYLKILFAVKYCASVSLFYRFVVLKKVDQIICEERVKLPEAVFFNLALKNNIDYIQFSNAPEQSSLVIKRLGRLNYREHPLSITNFYQYRNLKKAKSRISKEVFRLIKARYLNNNWYDRNLIHNTPTIEFSKKKINLIKSNKIITIFPHIFWDAPNTYFKDIFEDYKSWFDNTVRHLARIPNLTVIIKSHPDLLWKSKFISRKAFNHDKYFEELISEVSFYSKSNFYLLKSNSNINTLSLIKNSDAVLTVRGTVGLEAACFGIPCITAGTGRYSFNGFTIDSNQKKQYFRQIDNILKVNKLSQSKICRAHLLAFLIYKCKPIKIKSFETYRLSKQFSSINFINTLRNSKKLTYDVKNSKVHFFLQSSDYDLLNNEYHQ